MGRGGIDIGYSDGGKAKEKIKVKVKVNLKMKVKEKVKSERSMYLVLNEVCHITCSSLDDALLSFMRSSMDDMISSNVHCVGGSHDLIHVDENLFSLDGRFLKRGVAE